MIEQIKISSWNIWGLNDPNRSRVIRSWLDRNHQDIDLLCLQELKLKEADTVQIMPNTTTFIDYNELGRAGAVVLVAKHIKITECGCKGDGLFYWVTIETENGPLSIGSVYGSSRDPRRRQDLWKWMETNLHKGN